MGVNQEAIDAILNLKVGERTGAVTLFDPTDTAAGTFAILEVTSYEIPTDEELETTYREEYSMTKKTEIFEGILTTWVEEANYTINQRAYDAIA
jgi:hypothetical protein